MADETAKTMATVIQSFLLNVGINTEIKITEPGLMGGYFAIPQASMAMIIKILVWAAGHKSANGTG